MERKKKIMSECNFIGLQNNRLHYKCKECNDESFKSKSQLTKLFQLTKYDDKFWLKTYLSAFLPKSHLLSKIFLQYSQV